MFGFKCMMQVMFGEEFSHAEARVIFLTIGVRKGRTNEGKSTPFMERNIRFNKLCNV